MEAANRRNASVVFLTVKSQEMWLFLVANILKVPILPGGTT
jgi:hypothetical protein